LNESIQSLKDVLPKMKKSFDSLGISEPELNAAISNIYKNYDTDEVGY